MNTLPLILLSISGLAVTLFAVTSLYIIFRDSKRNNAYFEAHQLAKLAQNQEIK